jgi:subtilisin family serine protease
VPKKPWHLFGKNGINISPAWDITEGSTKVTVAIIDGKFLQDHAAFTKGQCLSTTKYIDLVKKNRRPDYHGSTVSSLIQTCEKNPLQLIGVNKRSRILWVDTGLDLKQLAQSMYWAAGASGLSCQDLTNINCSNNNEHPAHVINMSLGVHLNDYGWHNYFSYFVKEALKAGSILVAAAGNEARSADDNFPSALPGVISVGATNKDGNATAFSNWGETVEIMAPGADVPTVAQDGSEISRGTSLSAPLVSGVISLMRSVYQELNWKTAIYFLQTTAKKMDCHSYCIADRDSATQALCQKDCCSGEKQICTPGRMDAGAAVAAAKKAQEEGLPAVALVDANSFFVELTNIPNTTVKGGRFMLKNVGGAKGEYTITSKGDTLLFDEKRILKVSLSARGQQGDRVAIQVTTNSSFRSVTRIRIASSESGISSEFSDELTIFAGDID